MRFNIEFTLSKILAYLIFITGAAYAFTYQDASVMISLAATAGSVIAIKAGASAYQSKYKDVKHAD